MSTQPGSSPYPKVARTDVDELFATATPVRAGADLAREGVFDDDEVDEFLVDLHKMRHSDIA